MATFFFFGQQCSSVGNGTAIYMFERRLHVLVNRMGVVCPGVTGRRQVDHTSLELWFYCFIVEFRVNTEQRVQHRLLIQFLNNLHIVVLEVVCGSLPAKGKWASHWNPLTQ